MCSGCPDGANRLNGSAQAPVAQLDRALPSEGKGHTFESCRVRHLSKLFKRSPLSAMLAGKHWVSSPRGSLVLLLDRGCRSTQDSIIKLNAVAVGHASDVVTNCSHLPPGITRVKID